MQRPNLSPSRLATSHDEVLTLKKQLKAAEEKLFSTLPEQLGLQTVDDLIVVLAKYASPPMQALVKYNSNNTVIVTSRRRKAISHERRSQIIEALKLGTDSADQIARTFDVSTSAVNQIKGRAGLTVKRT